MTNRLQELLAVSALILRCEKIAAMGVLPEADEQSLRQLICQACRAFDRPTLAERDPANGNADYEAQMRALKFELEDVRR